MNESALATNAILRQGRYTVHECLGPSPMGWTYLARDNEQDGQTVTIEEFYPHGHCRRDTHTGPDGRPYTEVAILRSDAYQAKKLYDRFIAMARVLHSVVGLEGIAGVTAAFKEGGTAYYVHPYVPGPTLYQLIMRDGPLGHRRVMRYFAALCHTLDQLAMRGIRVGSLSPEHIIINSADDLPVIVETPMITSADAPAEGLSMQLLEDEAPQDDVYSLGMLLRYMVRDPQGYYPSWFLPQMQRAMEAALSRDPARRPPSPDALWTLFTADPRPVKTQKDTSPHFYTHQASASRQEELKPQLTNEEQAEKDARRGTCLLRFVILLLALSALIWIYLTFINP